MTRMYGLLTFLICSLSLVALVSCSSPESLIIEKVNYNVNTTYPYASDMFQFGERDVWQRPEQFLFVTKKGDCEDYAIAKAHILSNSYGFDSKKLFLVFLIPLDSSKNAHLVLRYGMYVLDNNSDTVTSLNALRDEYYVHQELSYYDYMRMQ